MLHCSALLNTVPFYNQPEPSPGGAPSFRKYLESSIFYHILPKLGATCFHLEVIYPTVIAWFGALGFVADSAFFFLEWVTLVHQSRFRVACDLARWIWWFRWGERAIYIIYQFSFKKKDLDAFDSSMLALVQKRVCKLLEKVKNVASRACCKLLEKVKSVAA